MANMHNQNDNVPVELCPIVRQMFMDFRVDRLRSETVVDKLNNRSASGKRWSARSLSQALKSVGIKPQNIRLGNRVVKGYTAESFTRVDEGPDREQLRTESPSAELVPLSTPTGSNSALGLRASVERQLGIPLESLQQALEASSDARLQRLIALSRDRAYQSYSFTALCREVGVQLRDIAEAWKQYQLSLGLARMFEKLPDVLADTAADAQARKVVCPECDGARETPNAKTGTVSKCTTCGGTGEVRISGDQKARGLIFEAVGLIGRQLPLVAIQQNFGEDTALDMSLAETLMLSQQIINSPPDPPTKKK